MTNLLLKGYPIGAIDGVLFDKDGTLSHSEPHLLHLAEERIQIALQLWKQSGQEQSQTTDLDQKLRRVWGVTPAGLDPASALAIASRRDNLTSMATVLCLHGCNWPEAVAISTTSFESVDQRLLSKPSINALLPGVEPFLSMLQKAGLCRAIISNDTEAGISSFLCDHGLTRLFDRCWSADHSPSKPDPLAVIHLCRDLNLNPKRCVLIGDAETDLQMASSAGVGLVLGFVGGWAIPPRLPTAQHQFDNWRDLTVGPAT
tara:strand:+ start:4166 stop:4942 length:777 start_codon:yes stop_codon:yes gene_type:complete